MSARHRATRAHTFGHSAPARANIRPKTDTIAKPQVSGHRATRATNAHTFRQNGQCPGHKLAPLSESTRNVAGGARRPRHTTRNRRSEHARHRALLRSDRHLARSPRDVAGDPHLWDDTPWPTEEP